MGIYVYHIKGNITRGTQCKILYRVARIREWLTACPVQNSVQRCVKLVITTRVCAAFICYNKFIKWANVGRLHQGAQLMKTTPYLRKWLSGCSVQPYKILRTWWLTTV